MFDIDGTLVESYDLDSICFINAVKDVTGIYIDSDWSKYNHVTDSGILREVLTKNGIPNKQETQVEVKKIFIEKLKKSIADKPVREISGAASLLTLLNSMNNVVVSLATGGWWESAILKLESAGIDFSSMIFASSNDHYSRIEIMEVSAYKATGDTAYPCTYFGDGSWDKEAWV